MEFFKINGKSIKAPTEISISYEELDKAERTVDGTMVVDIVGTKRRVDVSWEYLSTDDMAVLANAVKGGIFTGVSFHDNATGNLISITARAEGLAYLPHYDWAKSRLMWKSVSVSFTER
mgnify:FL=1